MMAIRMSQSLKFLLPVRIILRALLSMDDMVAKDREDHVEGREDFQWSERNNLNVFLGFLSSERGRNKDDVLETNALYE